MNLLLTSRQQERLGHHLKVSEQFCDRSVGSSGMAENCRNVGIADRWLWGKLR
jgi:hypothetical protein